MFRALVWKEWREQRMIVLAGLGIAVAMPFFLAAGASARARGLDLGDVAMLLPLFYSGLLWPLFAAAAGAATVATESGEGSLGFLLSRPVSRARVWTVKVAVAAAAAALVAAGTLVLAWGFTGIVRPSGPPGWRALLPWSTTGGPVSGVAPAGMALLLFGTSVFYSTVLRRTMTAAAAAVATSMALLAAILGLWSAVDVVPRFEPEWLALEVALASALFLGASWWTFSRGEMLRGRVFRRTALAAGTLGVGLLALATVPVLHAALRLTPRHAVLRDLIPAPDGSGILAEVTDLDYGSAQVWWVPADGAGYARLTGRLTLAPALSPDGRWVAYLSLRGPLGLRSRRPELRAVRVDGSGDRLLAAGLGTLSANQYLYLEASMRFDPASDRVALLAEGVLLVASLNGGPLRRRDPLPEGLGRAFLVGWTPDGREVILYRYRFEPQGASGRHHSEAAGLFAVDVETGEPRRLSGAGGWLLWPSMISPHGLAGGRMVVVRLLPGAEGAEDRDYEATVLDVVTGETEVFWRGPCMARADLSQDARWLAYADCERREARSRVRLRDLSTGEERLLAEIEERPTALLLSPRADRVLVGLGLRNDTLVIEADGTMHRFDPGLLPLGWSGRDRVLLYQPPTDDGLPRLIAAQATGGESRTLYP
jgi:hypothetical protein